MGVTVQPIDELISEPDKLDRSFSRADPPPVMSVSSGSLLAGDAGDVLEPVVLEPIVLEQIPDRRWGLASMHVGVLLACAAVVVLAAVLEVHGESEVRLFGYPLPESCAWRRIYGINCLGCGLTRSFVSLAHFAPLRAWHFNPAGPVLFAGLLFQLPYRGGQLWRIALRRPAWSSPVPLFLGWITLAVATLLVQWIVRVAWPMMFGA